jgi:hypothetical protein
MDLAVAAHASLARWNASRRAVLGLGEGTIVSANDALIRLLTRRSSFSATAQPTAVWSTQQARYLRQQHPYGL